MIGLEKLQPGASATLPAILSSVCHPIHDESEMT
jgi:hypothetical protein